MIDSLGLPTHRSITQELMAIPFYVHIKYNKRRGIRKGAGTHGSGVQ